MIWVLIICPIGWLNVCNTEVHVDYQNEKSCDKALVVVERQMKEQKIPYRAYCQPKVTK